MPDIQLLTQETIDKIAAGEVVERPGSVVKELVENAIDAGASAVTVEIKEGGISFIRITDNGCGIPHRQVAMAFLRHSTSKIRKIEDLYGIRSLGFRGEALSSIAAVSRVELITKTADELTGTRYLIEGSVERANEEIGAPEGTTFLVRDLFFNTPVRKKFLKTAMTEGNYVHDVVEKLALSHPEVSFKYIQNNQTKLHSSGNGNVKDLIYHIFGREIAASLFPVDFTNEYFHVTGFIGKPVITRGNRNFENYFINGRYVKSNLLAKGIEDAYKKFLMQHQYPFTVLYFEFKSDVDVNVHPTKMELRFGNNQEVYTALYQGLLQVLEHKDMIPVVPLAEDDKTGVPSDHVEEAPEPFEKRRLNDLRRAVRKDSPYEVKYPNHRKEISLPANPAASATKSTVEDTEKTEKPQIVTLKRKQVISAQSEEKKKAEELPEELPFTVSAGKSTPATYDPMSYLDINSFFDRAEGIQKKAEEAADTQVPPAADVPISGEQQTTADNVKINEEQQTPAADVPVNGEQQTLESLSPDFMTQDARRRYKIIGQLFATYWLVEYEEQLFIIDQHAAHEKVLFERTMKRLKDQEFTSQSISPPIVLTLDIHEVEMLEKYKDQITRIGYEIEHFGGKDYMITAVPDNLMNINVRDLFIEMLDDFVSIGGKETPELVLEKVASMSCKAAVKGNHNLSLPEIEALLDELLELDNPYHCPHGRPTIISMTKYEIEKKFKRIV